MNDNLLSSYIKDVPDFPKPGIIFKDISPLLASPEASKIMTLKLINHFKDKHVNVVVGIESRGFLFGMLMADALNAKFIMMRKPGKLPGEIMSQEYDLEYGKDQLEIQKDAINASDKVIIHDDVLATGGTAAAAHSLIEQAGASVLGYSFVIELDFLGGRKLLQKAPVYSVMNY
jgi:adenine phosphoribosyltransferase